MRHGDQGDATMRTKLGVSVLIAVLLVVVAAPTAGARHATVTGTMSGPGGFVPGGCNGVIAIRGTGTFTGSVLRSGTYHYDVCVTNPGVITFAGTASLTTARGTLSGTISGTFTGGPGPQFLLTLTAGTHKYRKTRGQLLLGPLAESDPYSCDPRIGICLHWTDTGPIAGSLTHVRHR